MGKEYEDEYSYASRCGVETSDMSCGYCNMVKEAGYGGLGLDGSEYGIG